MYKSDKDEPRSYTSQTERIVQSSNVKFNIDGQILHAETFHLCRVSPVFATMFKRDFRGKEQHAIKLPGKDYKAMLMFIEVSHMGYIPSLENVFHIIPICYEYQCTKFLKYCGQALMYNDSFLNDLQALIKTLALESKYTSEILKQKCLSSAEISVMDKAILWDCLDYIFHIIYHMYLSSLSNNRYWEIPKMIEQSYEVREKVLIALIDMGMGEGCISDHSNFRERFFTKFEVILKVFGVKRY